MTQLSKNFSLKELLKSTTADRHNFTEQYRPPTTIIFNLKLLAREILQPAREFFRLPLRITSGYRCTRLNNAVGGSKTSDHTKGLAGDIEGHDESVELYIAKVDCPCGKPVIELRDRLSDDTHIVPVNAAIALFIAFNREGEYNQLISEYGTEGNPSWVHCSVPELGITAKGEILRKGKGKPYVRLTKEELWEQITG